MKIYLASDHAGFELKEELKDYLQGEATDFIINDMGTYSTEPVSWAEYGAKAAQKFRKTRKIQKEFLFAVLGSACQWFPINLKMLGLPYAMMNTRQR